MLQKKKRNSCRFFIVCVFYELLEDPLYKMFMKHKRILGKLENENKSDGIITSTSDTNYVKMELNGAGIVIDWAKPLICNTGISYGHRFKSQLLHF